MTINTLHHLTLCLQDRLAKKAGSKLHIGLVHVTSISNKVSHLMLQMPSVNLSRVEILSVSKVLWNMTGSLMMCEYRL